MFSNNCKIQAKRQRPRLRNNDLIHKPRLGNELMTQNIIDTLEQSKRRRFISRPTIINITKSTLLLVFNSKVIFNKLCHHVQMCMSI